MFTELLFSFFLLILSLFSMLFTSKNSILHHNKTIPSSPTSNLLPKSYPIIGSYFAIYANRERRVEWLSDMIKLSPSATFVLNRFFGQRQIFTGNPSNVQHILKTHFRIYPKGELLRCSLHDFLGDGIFNINGDAWKFQRQVSSHEFNRKSLCKFVEHVVDAELSGRLIPILASAAKNDAVLDLQDILQRFTFDNICKIAFGYDPAYLLPSLPPAQFAEAFEEAVMISSGRLNSILPIIWKLKRFLCMGSEKRLKEAVSQVRGFARDLIREKRKKMRERRSQDVDLELDILSRFLMSGHSDEDFVIDIVISFIHAGRDTTSAALTWFFWLVSQNPRVEREILDEIAEKTGTLLAVYEETRDMVYTHASLCESMRLYPPVPVDTKEATVDDVLPDGTRVKKGTRVVYHPYAMGRLPELWGADWPDFMPERWLAEGGGGGKWGFVGPDPYKYPVFQAGPRICLGKEMAFLQMKRVVAAVLGRFRVVPAMEKGAEPAYSADLTSKMKDGFPVRIQERNGLL
ncbi:cytochrome P450 94A2-like [Syzygium oleosum]|uniref:cytochrome P450 94A2-like n=1 Tax=Syzygium oleosum TaxID=219896 RepID=UPI0011D2B9C8|nr:cytochrome P450 94A2-like [Syzygium oleosum]